MSSLFKAYKMNKQAEVEGITIKFGANDDGSIPSFKIARMGSSNTRYMKTLEIEVKPYQRQIELDTLDKMLEAEVLRRVFVRSVLMAWENVQGEDGTPLAFNEENALQLFRDLPELYTALAAEAMKMQNFRAALLESNAKN